MASCYRLLGASLLQTVCCAGHEDCRAVCGLPAVCGAGQCGPQVHPCELLPGMKPVPASLHCMSQRYLPSAAHFAMHSSSHGQHTEHTGQAKLYSYHQLAAPASTRHFTAHASTSAPLPRARSNTPFGQDSDELVVLGILLGHPQAEPTCRPLGPPHQPSQQALPC